MKITDEIRAQYRTAKQIREGGAIANLFCGANITVHGLDTRLLAWPGNGFQTQSVHVTTIQPGQQSDQYTYMTLLRKRFSAVTALRKYGYATSGSPYSLEISRISLLG
jgi:hypothetical protein